MALATSAARPSVSARVTPVVRTTAAVCVSATLMLEVAHALELAPKMRYAAALYVDVNQTLYPGFAIVGAVAEVVGVLAALGLAVLLWRGSARTPAIVAAAGAVLALALWAALVAPANTEMGTWTHSSVPADWERWRAQWEITHAVCILPLSVALVALRRVRIHLERRR
jgi:hypothetical protein